MDAKLLTAAMAMRGLRRVGGEVRRQPVQTATAEPAPPKSRQQIRREKRKEAKAINKMADRMQRKQHIQELRNGKPK